MTRLSVNLLSLVPDDVGGAEEYAVLEKDPDDSPVSPKAPEKMAPEAEIQPIQAAPPPEVQKEQTPSSESSGAPPLVRDSSDNDAPKKEKENKVMLDISGANFLIFHLPPLGCDRS